MTIKAVILDRDGTLIEHVPYLCEPERVVLLPGVAEGIRLLRESGLRLFLHTNQSGIGRGYYTIAQAVACNERMIELLACGAAPFEGICVAPEHPDAENLYRKPSPRYARELAAAKGWEMCEICYLGDSAVDMRAALNAGCLPVALTTGVGDFDDEAHAAAFAGLPRFGSFRDAVDHILSR